MFILYIANKNYSSWSLRPWILLQELGIPFEERCSPFTDGESGASYSAFRAFSPNGKVPCLIDGACTIWDSLSIAEYVAQDYPEVWPTDRERRAWARSVCAEMHSGFQALRNQCTMNCGIRVRLTIQSGELTQDIHRLTEIWNEGLARFGGPFLTGAHFTAADAFFAPVALRFQTYQLETQDPAVEYLQRILALPGMQQWQHAALAETWREPTHEAEAMASGIWLADYRKVA